MPRDDSRGIDLLTLPGVHRQYGLGLKTIRAAAARGDFPVYSAGTGWPRVRRDEFEQWISSTRIEPIAQFDLVRAVGA